MKKLTTFKNLMLIIFFIFTNSCHTGGGDPVDFEVATKDTYFNYFPTKLEQLLDHPADTKFDGVISLLYANLYFTETDDNNKVTSEGFKDLLLGEADFYESVPKFIDYFSDNQKEECNQYFEEKVYLGKDKSSIPDNVKIPQKLLIGHLAFSAREKSSDKEEKTIFKIPILQMKDDAGSIDVKNILQTKLDTPILFNTVYSLANWDKDKEYDPYIGFDGNSIIDKFKVEDVITFPPKIVLTEPSYDKVTEKNPLKIKNKEPLKIRWDSAEDFNPDKLKLLHLILDLKSNDKDKKFRSVTECYIKDNGTFDLDVKFIKEIFDKKGTGTGNLSLTRYSEQTINSFPVNKGKVLFKISLRQQIPVEVE